MKVTVKGTLTQCEDCGSEHLGQRCGMTFQQRLRSIDHDTDWMPAKNAMGRNYHRKNYYDKEPIKDLFGEDAREEMMEDTKGRGPLYDVRNASEEDYNFYMESEHLAPECDDPFEDMN